MQWINLSKIQTRTRNLHQNSITVSQIIHMAKDQISRQTNLTNKRISIEIHTKIKSMPVITSMETKEIHKWTTFLRKKLKAMCNNQIVTWHKTKECRKTTRWYFKEIVINNKCHHYLYIPRKVIFPRDKVKRSKAKIVHILMVVILN